MARSCPAALRRLASAAAPAAADADPALLRAFLTARSEPAFAELVRRHGPMVLAVCRRVLGHAQDAEDACQAAFIVLARKAGSVRGANVAGWLYGVAVRTARGVRIMRDRRRLRGQETGARGQDNGSSGPDADLLNAELVAILDEELAALPDLFRLPVVLCELQGKSRKEAAAELNVPEGTLSSRLAAAKRKLADRLARRGVTASAAALTAVLAGHAAAQVPCELVRAATGAIPRSAVAAQVADGVVKALFAAQLKGMVVAVGLAFALAGGLLATTGTGGTATAAPADPKAGGAKPSEKADPATALVRQLGDADFKAREAAARKLQALGAKAIPALQAGTRDPNPEVARRAAEVLAVVRAAARADLAKRFDPKSTTDYDHPVWQRYKAIAGDTPASRDVFVLVIANAKWLRTLDAAEVDPADAGHTYRVGIAQMFRDFDTDPARSPPWPCDRPEEVAYLMLLGSHPDPNPPVKLVGDEAIPAVLRGTEFLGRGIIHGEEQIIHARGLELGLDGRWLAWQTRPAVAGTDQVFAKLFVAWLTRRDPAAPVVHRGLRTVGRELLPFARKIAANDFEPKRTIPTLTTLTALEQVARFGTPADLPLFERHFADETNAAAADKNRDDGARDYYRAKPLTDTTQVRDVALALALLLHGRNPADFGFVVRKDTFEQKDGRYLVPGFVQLHLGFKDEAARTAAFTKAKAWLAEQKKPDQKK